MNIRSRFRAGRRSARFLRAAVVIPWVAAGCTGTFFILGPNVPAAPLPATDLDLAISIAQPAEEVTATPGAAAIIRWADLATLSGTIVRVTAQRENDLQEPVGDPLQLIGDGTQGVGRDAIGDGDNDIFEWDITGVRIGDYVITVTLDAPDGRSISVRSRDDDRGTTGVLTVTTALPIPTLTFTAPGAADVTVNTNTTFNITWTDNGPANAAAVVRLALDPDTTAADTQHNSGNEINLLTNDPLSTSGTGGLFTFAFVDADGNAVPLGTYTVFAVIDDNAHDPVTVSATGRLILAP